jgi:hypothetical protein
MTKKIYLRGERGKGLYTLVDDEDFEYLNQFKWFISKCGYAMRTFKDGKKNRSMRMHRILMHNPKGKVVDHINHNTLDNCKENLRVCSSYQNQWNMQKTNNKTTSKYKGVYFNKNIRKYHAQITINNKKQHLGFFETEEEAGLAYNKKAKELFGEFAVFNKVAKV